MPFLSPANAKRKPRNPHKTRKSKKNRIADTIYSKNGWHLKIDGFTGLAGDCGFTGHVFMGLQAVAKNHCAVK